MSSAASKVIFTFDHSPREASRFAAKLEAALWDVAAIDDAAFAVERVKPDPNTQDFGTAVAVIFGTPTAIALANGLFKWLTRHNQVRLRVETPDGTVIAENLESRDVPDIVAALTARRP